MRRFDTLAARTGMTLTAAFLVFMLIAVASMVYYILIPLARQGADDLAALMVLAAQSWVELPPQTRPFLELELMQEYRLNLALSEEPLPRSTSMLPFLRFLEKALERRVGQAMPISVCLENGISYCAEIPMGGRTIRTCFPRERIGARPPTAALLVLAGGGVITLLTSLLLVRRLTRPLADLSQAAGRFGRAGTLEPLSVTGPREIANLTQSFNRMEQHISELLANRTILFAGISHDLRTPITRMQLALAMLPEDADPQLVEGLRRDLDLLNQLIGDTLALAQGLDLREPEEVDLREFIDGVLADYRRGDGDIIWQPRACCLCSVDPLALRRACVNLLDNAVRYGAGQPVEVRCHCNGTSAGIDVLDRGPGIPAAQREAVFQPFHRLETSRSRATGGSGLGLAIARQLCAAHGWHIELLEREGGGTIARVRIPFAT